MSTVNISSGPVRVKKVASRNRDIEAANWKSCEIVNDHLVLIDDESAAVGLREMTISEEADKQLSKILAAPSRSRLVARDLPSA